MFGMQGCNCEGWHECYPFQHQQPYNAFKDAYAKEHNKIALPILWEQITCRLKDVQAVSFTTDIWTFANVFAESVHWVDTVSPSAFACC